MINNYKWIHQIFNKYIPISLQTPPSHNSKSLLHDITIKDSSSLIDHDEFFNEVYSRGIFLIDVPANEIHTYTTGYILWQFRP